MIARLVLRKKVKKLTLVLQGDYYNTRKIAALNFKFQARSGN